MLIWRKSTKIYYNANELLGYIQKWYAKVFLYEEKVFQKEGKLLFRL